MRSRMLLAIIAMFLLLVTGTAGQVRAGGGAGAVFVMSNRAAGNSVLVWSRATDGSLDFVGRTPTGGQGSGGFLNNQGGLFLSANGRWLYVVDAGSDQVSVLRVDGTGLTLKGVAPSHGDRPISVTAHGNVLYVLNAGGGGNIRGFHRTAGGDLSFIPGSGRPLTSQGAGPAQIDFSPDGSHLVVAERFSHRLGVYSVDGQGVAHGPDIKPSAGAEPFGFAFAPDGTLVVSEAGDHVEDGSSVSSYRFRASGSLRTVSSAVPTTETAACWTAITPDGRFAYVTNTPDHSISGFEIAGDGSLSILDADGVTAATGPGTFPLDLDTSADGGFLYVLVAGTAEVQAYRIQADGDLSALAGESGLPGSANGLVAR